MKLLEIARFEIAYQLRRPWAWLYLAAIFALSFQIVMEAYTENARDDGYLFNSPFVILSVTVLASAMGLLVAAAMAGEAGARDVQTRMHSLVWTSPLARSSYIGGRFVAAFVLCALIQLAAQLALVASSLMPGVPQDLLGPPATRAYVVTYLLVALPSAFVATALLFSLAVLTRRAIASYIGAVFLFFASMLLLLIVAARMGEWDLATMLDPLGMTLVSEISRKTTAAQKNDLLLTSQWAVLRNRAIWLTISGVVLAFTTAVFRFRHPSQGGRREREAADGTSPLAPIVATRVPVRFDPATRMRQLLTVTRRAFRDLAFSWGGLVLVLLSLVLVLFGPSAMNHLGVPTLPTTSEMTDWVGNTGEIIWTIVPILTVLFAGELVWRDRETGMSEIADAVPVPEWIRIAGSYAGLALIFVAYQALLVVGCILIQLQLGYRELEPGLYLRVVFGLQLVDHLLFALLAIAVHVVVNQKYVGYLVLLAAFAFTMTAAGLGIEHRMLVYGASPAWSHSDIRGFGPSVAPWAWYKAYWGAWALLLAVVARVFWMRGREPGLRPRLALARRRLTRPTLAVAGAAMAMVLTVGGFILWNTTSLNAFETEKDWITGKAEYERRYSRFANAPQPSLAAIALRVEIDPERRRAEIGATYRLVNHTSHAIDSIHFLPDAAVETGAVTFDRPATLALDDRAHDYRIYRLGSALAPGDTITLRFDVRFQPRGFTNAGVSHAVSGNGTYFEGHDWLPEIGYLRTREISSRGQRRELGLPDGRRSVLLLEDTAATMDRRGAERIAFEAVVGTAEGQLAVAPGALRRQWTEDGRSWFHYVADAPIRYDFAIYSARYAVGRDTWREPSGREVALEVIHHPGHGHNVERMLRGMRASLELFTREYGPYRYAQLRMVEHASRGNSLHASPVNVSYEEGFSLFDPGHDSRDIDFAFAVVAHEVAHNWWGGELNPADVQGSPLLTESLAWYSAMQVVSAEYGEAHLARLLEMLRDVHRMPRARGSEPLLRAQDKYHAYRKGPFAMHALREYVGADRVSTALRALLREHGGDAPPWPTSLDLYAELQAVTPDSLRGLLGDLFERNTFWELEAKEASAKQAADGAWEVTLDVAARKVVADTSGAETERPMDDLIEIGVSGEKVGAKPGPELYRRMHRIRAGRQRIVVTVPARPARAAIDPRGLLLDDEPEDNDAAVETGAP